MNDVAIDYMALESAVASFTDSNAQRAYSLDYLASEHDAGIGAPTGDPTLGTAVHDAIAAHVSTIVAIDGHVHDLVERMRAIAATARRADADAAGALEGGG